MDIAVAPTSPTSLSVPAFPAAQTPAGSPLAAVAPPTDASGEVAAADAVVVRLGQGRFAVGLDVVAEVGRVPRCTRVPGLPAWMAGVANWRGRILPVLDLHDELGVGRPGSAPAKAARLLVLTDGGLTVGFIVDAVDGTTTLAEVEPLPATLAGQAEALLTGQMADPAGPVAVLDVAAVLAMRHRLPQGRRSA